jgi:hypothetical protein
MVSNSMRRRSKGRSQWRFIVGLSVLGLLIIASASHATQFGSSASFGSNASPTLISK